MYDPTKLVFTDCETTGLDVRRHDAWEIAWIIWEENLIDGPGWQERVRRIWPPTLQDADPIALSINQFYERTTPIRLEVGRVSFDDPREVAEEIAYDFAGKHIVGACPWFDAAFYEKLLRAHGYQLAWHYHLIDVEALAVGFLGDGFHAGIEFPLPWKSEWLSKMLRVERPAEKERHTALGDAREVKATFEHIMGTHDGSPPNKG